MQTTYFYRIEHGKATLNRGDDSRIKTIGNFRNDAQAREACEAHYAKACKALANLGQALPAKFYV